MLMESYKILNGRSCMGHALFSLKVAFLSCVHVYDSTSDDTCMYPNVHSSVSTLTFAYMCWQRNSIRTIRLHLNVRITEYCRIWSRNIPNITFASGHCMQNCMMVGVKPEKKFASYTNIIKYNGKHFNMRICE